MVSRLLLRKTARKHFSQKLQVSTVFQFPIFNLSCLLDATQILFLWKDTLNTTTNSLSLTSTLERVYQPEYHWRRMEKSVQLDGVLRVGHESNSTLHDRNKHGSAGKGSKRDEIKWKDGEVDCARHELEIWTLSSGGAPWCRAVLSEGRTRPCRRCIWLSHYLVVCGRHSTFRRYVNVVYSTVQRWGGRGVAMISHRKMSRDHHHNYPVQPCAQTMQ